MYHAPSPSPSSPRSSNVQRRPAKESEEEEREGESKPSALTQTGDPSSRQRHVPQLEITEFTEDYKRLPDIAKDY